MAGSSWVYGLLIHSCFADDGQGNKFELIDDRGCSTDSYLLPQIQYEPNSLSAFTNAQVFKYADKVQLYFTCTVQLCYKHDGGCEGVTPPSCEPDSVHFPDVGPHHPPFKVPDAGPPRRIPPGHSSKLLMAEDLKLKNNIEHLYSKGEDEHHERSIFKGLPPNPKPFFGPVSHIDDYDSSKYRDSPLNETEVEEHSLAHTNDSDTDDHFVKTIKKRRDLNMETDLSVDVIVLPFDEKFRPTNIDICKRVLFEDSYNIAASVCCSHCSAVQHRYVHVRSAINLLSEKICSGERRINFRDGVLGRRKKEDELRKKSSFHLKAFGLALAIDARRRCHKYAKAVEEAKGKRYEHSAVFFWKIQLDVGECLTTALTMLDRI
ncbi:hypothetical protein Aduo_001490 [Ancylostoma duodenale]